GGPPAPVLPPTAPERSPWQLDLPELPPLAPAARQAPTSFVLPPAFLAQPPVPTPAAAPPAPASPSGRRLLPIRIPAEEAKKRTAQRVFGVERVELVRVPVHVFDYECDLLVDGSLRTDTLDGRVQVHGCDRSATIVAPDEVNPDGTSLVPDVSAYACTERVLRVQPERARELALEAVLKEHTRKMDVRVPDTDGRFFYTEKRKVAPQRDHVRLTLLGTFDRPVWRLFGTNGHLDLDALDGKVVDQQLSRTNADVLVLE
ncbi:MAG TPA: hypothetical protein VFH47_02565, partial [Candidatus Thermoplasmatota archaeon]|nr:hypothetical protein [Candidatus Thermoplasmatota archaeon]